MCMGKRKWSLFWVILPYCLVFAMTRNITLLSRHFVYPPFWFEQREALLSFFLTCCCRFRINKKEDTVYQHKNSTAIRNNDTIWMNQFVMANIKSWEGRLWLECKHVVENTFRCVLLGCIILLNYMMFGRPDARYCCWSFLLSGSCTVLMALNTSNCI